MNKKWHGVLFITTKCNLSCRHCSVREDPGREMPLDMMKKIVDYGPRKVNIMGGEPLLYSHLDDLLEIFNGVQITVQTNGLLVPKRIKFLENVRQVICSVEGMEKNTNFIRGKGVFKKVINSVKMLKDSGISVLLRSSLFEGNLSDVPDLIDLARKLDVGLYFYPMLGEPSLNTEQQLWLFRQLEKYEKAWLDLPHYFCVNERRSFCSAGISRLAFTVDGRILPCQWMDNYTLGYVGDDFEAISNEADFFAETMKPVPNECLGCRWQDLCRGGCPLVSWYIGCPIRPEVREYVEVSPSTFGGSKKAEAVAKLLKGTVTC